MRKKYDLKHNKIGILVENSKICERVRNEKKRVRANQNITIINKHGDNYLRQCQMYNQRSINFNFNF